MGNGLYDDDNDDYFISVGWPLKSLSEEKIESASGLCRILMKFGIIKSYDYEEWRGWRALVINMRNKPS